MPDKALVWLGSSRNDLRSFPAIARRLAGFQLRRIQQGWIRTTGSRCEQSDRESAKSGFTSPAHTGMFYVATRPEALYVLHAFEKKTQKTSPRDLRIGRDRFRALGKSG